MKYLPLLAVLALLTGCASTTTFTSLPKSESEFLLSKPQLTEKYPEIATYEKRWRGLSPEHPTEESLFKELGEPQHTERDMLFPIQTIAIFAILKADLVTLGMFLAIIPDIPTTHYYKKGNYCIEAHTLRTIGDLYVKSMGYWEWKENAKTCE